MDNNNQQNFSKSSELRDYLIIFLQYKFVVISIFLVCIIIAFVYSYTALSIYSADGSIKVAQPKSNILSGPLLPEFQEFGSDRYIANEIEILKSISLREIAAKSIIDTFGLPDKRDSFYVLLKDKKDPKAGLIGYQSMLGTLKNAVSIEQKRGLDIITLSAESHSPYEAALMVNCFINAYYTFNLKSSRTQLTLAREFLEEQKQAKQKTLEVSENALQNFQESGKIVSLDDQAKMVVDKLSDFESQMNAADIELKSKQRNLSDLKSKLTQLDSKVAKYVETIATEPYVKMLQEQIARLEVQKQVVLSRETQENQNQKELDNYTNSITELQSKLNEKLNSLQAGLLNYSPSDLRALSLDVLKLDLETKAGAIKFSELRKVVQTYENRFNKLPQQMIEYAKLERNRKSDEKLYILLEEKYQEALISEQSKPGNVQIIDPARVPTKPSKPNRTLVIMVGFVLGLGFGVGFVFLKKYFNVSIRTPEDIQNRGVNVLGWVPKADDFFDDFKTDKTEILVQKHPDSIPLEAFLSIKMKLQFSRLTDNPIKIILITSPTPSEGKTFVCSNLASTFAVTNNKTLVIDMDLRRPRGHSIFNLDRQPGLTDYLFKKASLQDIIKPTEVKNLDMVTAGTITPNPAEIVSSQQIADFLDEMRAHYDFILIDTPPIVAVADAGVLSRLAEATVLVVSTNQTRIDLMENAIETLRSVQGHFVGVLMNNFSVKNGYGSYYRYYHYYSKKYKSTPSKKGKKNS